ncbi:hypothetical protein [Leptospira santarosai]|uniref:hypothetical protein n=1 Tax=Leptospira santarosai TaxID=28183 RepID=UPI001F3CE2EB
MKKETVHKTLSQKYLGTIGILREDREPLNSKIAPPKNRIFALNRRLTTIVR